MHESVFSTTTLSGVAIAAGGSGAFPASQKQPLQIGWSELPPSYSTHTFAPTGGTAKKPTRPARPTASPSSSVPPPVTAGTDTMTRPAFWGSTLFSTFPRYLPKYVGHGTTTGVIEPVPSRREREALLVLALADRVATLLT